ncbi:FliC/FljB family flagellin [Lamprobacter modestohalophilus]|uniref:FliC/FljB family flagellin n=1 Tax=Lamprobacter modestohalophilus TaxID=1064514 RepID=UPI002ADEC5E3|nr:FliC/FljB family flagellin [Lamprobacter modestohalophilus]MEA1053153.1 FliC/FljB family flagellin [Lamprobacter modestohalophilus]
MSIINTNITSLIGQSNLNSSKNDLTTAMERLSSGLRINSAKDDAAGQAIANRFSSQITGLNQAMRNANDGISIAQTAEGALNMINDNVQRIRELSVQAANDTNNANDLQSIQDEISQRLNEIDRISAETDFNGTTVLGRDFNLGIQVGANDDERIDIDMEEITSQTLGIGTFNVTGPADVSGTATTTIDWASGGVGISADSTAIEDFFGASTAISTLDIDETGTFVDDLAARIGIASGSITSPVGTDVQMDDRGNLFAEVVIEAADQTEIDNLAARGIEVDGTNATTFYIALDPEEAGLDAVPTSATTATWTLDGASLAFTDLSRGSTTDPMETLDTAINQIDSLRSNLGAIQNRFQDAISNLETNSINLSDARSRIEDADYAKEVANMTRAQILQQAGTSVLAQANQIPQNVLSLLG